MDEASSKFVDRLALEKMLAEKLSVVRHTPSKQPDALRDDAFDALAASIGRPEILPGLDPKVVVLKSPLWSAYPENRTLPLHHYPSEDERGIILLVHGLFEDNRAMYGFLIGELNRLGYTVYMTTLPFHHERTSEEARFSGEFFFSADLARTKEAFIQAVLEVRSAAEWIRQIHAVPSYIAGFSMGGTVALGAAAASDLFDGVCIINPAAMLSEVLWTSPLCTTIKEDLMDAGWGQTEVDFVVSTFDPYVMPHLRTSPDKILMIYALFDQITSTSQYEALIERKKLCNILKYKAGHLNTLRVPRFASDLAYFFDRLDVPYETERKVRML